MEQDERDPEPTPQPTRQELPPDSPYRQRPGETVQQTLQRVPGPVKILGVEVPPPPDPFEGCEQRHRDRAKAISDRLGLK